MSLISERGETDRASEPARLLSEIAGRVSAGARGGGAGRQPWLRGRRRPSIIGVIVGMLLDNTGR